MATSTPSDLASATLQRALSSPRFPSITASHVAHFVQSPFSVRCGRFAPESENVGKLTPRRLPRNSSGEPEPGFMRDSPILSPSFMVEVDHPRPMRFRVALEAQPEGGLVAQCIEVPGAITQGETEEEALENIQEAIALILDVRRQRARHSGAHVETVEVDA